MIRQNYVKLILSLPFPDSCLLTSNFKIIPLGIFQSGLQSEMDRDREEREERGGCVGGLGDEMLLLPPETDSDSC